MKYGINMANVLTDWRLWAAVVAIIFGILILAFPALLGILVGIALIIWGILEIVGLATGTPITRAATTAVTGKATGPM